MQQTFLELVYKTFYDVAQKEQKDVKLLISEKFYAPKIKLGPKNEIQLPLPKKKNGGYLFNGILFDKSTESKITLWSLFLASIYHLAAHAAVSDYSIYKQWIKGKTPSVYWKVIDTIEDHAVTKFLSATDPEIWENLLEIDKILKQTNENSKLNNKIAFQFGKKRFEQFKQEMNKESLLCFDEEHTKKVLSWADFLYKNKNLLPDKTPLYAEIHDLQNILKIKQRKFEIFPTGNFENKVQKLSIMHDEDEEKTEKFLRRTKKFLSNLDFDDVVLPREDVYEYLILKEKNHKLIKKIRDQIRTVVNNTENPETNFYGEIDLEKAIQAIANNAERYAEVFDKDEDQRIEEAWGILIDNSASMRLRFEPVKDFMLCLAEASDELTGPAGSWGLYSFDQRFSIIKDVKSTYNQDVKARIGGLKGGGLSHSPDAIVLAGKILSLSPGDIKHLFVFTDDFPTGQWGLEQKLYDAVKDVEKLGIDVIGIGLSKNITNYFSTSCWGAEIKELVAKFVRTYRQVSSKNL